MGRNEALLRQVRLDMLGSELVENSPVLVDLPSFPPIWLVASRKGAKDDAE